MDRVNINSEGTLGTTSVTLNDRRIMGSDLMHLRVFQESEVKQVACEFTYIEDGSIKRWSGVNLDDEFQFFLHAAGDDAGSCILATKEVITVKAEGVSVFPGATMVIEVVADGYSVAANQYRHLAPKLPSVRDLYHA